MAEIKEETYTIVKGDDYSGMYNKSAGMNPTTEEIVVGEVTYCTVTGGKDISSPVEESVIYARDVCVYVDGAKFQKNVFGKHQTLSDGSAKSVIRDQKYCTAKQIEDELSLPKGIADYLRSIYIDQDGRIEMISYTTDKRIVGSLADYVEKFDLHEFKDKIMPKKRKRFGIF